MADTQDRQKKKWKVWRAALYGLTLSLLMYGFYSLGFGDEDLPAPRTAELAAVAGFVASGPIIFLLVALIRNHFVQRSK